ncbi:MAG: esterase-like activity of phytase family protein [Phenylobacterium sp.]|uniref:esterase-like activity of phytase family protein n=1 Tax=Phenylobacterium sp. TaxID=1871053 RepID=UPI002A36B95B|nr:esterase-like activity of phytase family protein [Phenylobacterium sp.]MDX9998980.1 esterase-like activity of phytase family protein [Phenylobacterium sp.]
MSRSLLAGLGAALLLAACAPAPAPLPSRPVPADGTIVVSAKPVPLNPEAPDLSRIGRFAYAGGVELASDDTARLHGLSDVEITPDGRLVAISDEGDLLEARIVLDREGRLAGLAEARIAALPGLDGQPLPGKQEADSEGLAVMPNGDRLVSFELNHRIWLYPADGGPPRPAPSPQITSPPNGGMEALAPDPEAGPDAYIAGGEDSAQLFHCRLSAGCTPGATIDRPGREFGLVALRRLPEGRTAYLLRAWDPLRGNRIVLKIDGPQGEVDRLELSRPFTVDNFEALAAAPIEGGLRFYILSDDNFQRIQRTLLLAFDWRP